jgi:hypothetical protein
MLLGNPLSGLNSAPELLPSGWGQVGQWLPQGANATLLRSTAFFDGAGATTPLLVLTCWALVGTLLIVFAGMRQSGAARRRPADYRPATVQPAVAPSADGYFRDTSGAFRRH